MRRPMPVTQPDIAERLLAGDKRALARAITLVENDDPAGWELVREVYPHTGHATVTGFTGAPGAGKSTLIGALTKLRREAGETVAVLSIDPSSPFTHGALLGDRIRLTDHFLDPGVFIRSMANRGALGGLSEAALQAALLMDASGRDHVLLGLSVLSVLSACSNEKPQAKGPTAVEVKVMTVQPTDAPARFQFVGEFVQCQHLIPAEGLARRQQELQQIQFAVPVQRCRHRIL